jgi:uncharacterized membrane protein
MTKGRLEAFSDGVIAVVITIMVLELHVPAGADWAALLDIAPTFLTYVVSFVFVAIYWNNHHHLLHAVERVNGKILWANMHLLFWLSLVPFTTGWAGLHKFAPLPTAIYGVVLLMCGVAYAILTAAFIGEHGPDSPLATAVGNRFKERASTALYLAAIALAFVKPEISAVFYVLVALIWLVPDPRIEAKVRS